jgi:hypothetical protein
MRHMQKRSRWLVLALGLLACGCGRHAAKVSGDVRLGDRPLTSGVVTFTPVAPGPSAYGNVSGEGRYTLQTGAENGLEPGDYTVTVAANATPEEAAKMGIKVGREGIMPLLTPPKYADVKTSPLKVTVKRGTQTIDLALDPKPTGRHP